MGKVYYCDVPITSFPRKFSRDYKDTYLYPPMKTTYGMLLSLIGELNWEAYSMDCLRIGMLSEPTISRILRKQRSMKYAPGGGDYPTRAKKYGADKYPSQLHNRPNYQEILTDVRFAVEVNDDNLVAKIDKALQGDVERFGILSLGESWSVVNQLREYRLEDGEVQWLQPGYNR